MVKNPPVMRETQVRSRGREDPLEKGKANTPVFLGFPSQLVKNPPAMWQTWVRSLGREDTLKEETATHSSILAWRIPRTEEPGGLQSVGSKKSLR